MAHRPPAPFAPPLAGTAAQQIAALAAELNKKASRNTEETFPSLLMRSPDGNVWRVSIANGGTLSVTAAT